MTPLHTPIMVSLITFPEVHDLNFMHLHNYAKVSGTKTLYVGMAWTCHT